MGQNLSLTEEQLDAELKAKIELIEAILSASKDGQHRLNDIYFSFKSYILHIISMGLILNYGVNGPTKIANIKKIVAHLIGQLATRKTISSDLNKAAEIVFADIKEQDRFWQLLSHTLVNIMQTDLDPKALEEMAQHMVKAHMYYWSDVAASSYFKFSKLGLSLETVLDYLSKKFRKLSDECDLDNTESFNKFFSKMKQWTVAEEKKDIQRQRYTKLPKIGGVNFFITCLMVAVLVSYTMSTRWGGFWIAYSMFPALSVLFYRNELKEKGNEQYVYFSQLDEKKAREACRQHQELRFAVIEKVKSSCDAKKQKPKPHINTKKEVKEKIFKLKEPQAKESSNFEISKEAIDLLPQYVLKPPKLKTKGTTPKQEQEETEESLPDNIKILKILNEQKECEYFIIKCHSDDPARTTYGRINRAEIIKNSREYKNEYEPILNNLIKEAKEKQLGNQGIKKLKGFKKSYETRDSSKFRLFGMKQKETIKLEKETTEPLEIKVINFGTFGPGLH